MSIVSFAAGIAAVLLSQFLLASAFVGVGLLVRRAYGLAKVTRDDLFATFWLGFSGVVLALMLWNFLLPIDALTLLVVLVVGATGLILQRRALGGIAREGLDRRWGIVALLAALWVANLGLGDMTYFDSALYHMQTVQWAERYRLVPGLANLSAPLAYNNASLLYSAMLDVGPWAGLGFRLSNGLLLQVFLLRIVVAIARVSRDPRSAPSRELFVAMLLPAAISLAYFGRLSSYATAPPTAILVLVVAEQLYGLLVQPRSDAREAAFEVVSIVILSAVCVALKLSAVIYCALAVFVALGVWLRRRAQRRGEVRRALVFALGAALLIGGAWTLRGVILSGYPAFPSRAVTVPVDWRVPADHADAEYALVEHSSKVSTMLDDVIAGRDRWGWLPRWTRVQLSEPFYVVVPLGIALLAGLVAPALRVSPARSRAGWLLVVAILPALVAWFWLAPEGRYATGFCWALAALASTRLWHGIISRATHARFAIWAAITALVTLVATPLVTVRHAAPLTILKTVIKQNVKVWEGSAWRTRPAAPQLDSFVTQSGLVLSVPREQCWDARPPCTQNPARNLELRSPANIAAGFRVNGEWAMENWPAKTRPNFLAAWRESRRR